MQTFLPFGSDFQTTAQCLDNKRLGKQRVENLQIIKALIGQTKAWSNHPATKQWSNYLTSLIKYHCVIVAEWNNRGYKDTTLETINTLPGIKTFLLTSNEDPFWLDDQNLLFTHKGNLYRKDPVFYSQFKEFKDYERFTCCEKCNYWWFSHTWAK